MALALLAPPAALGAKPQTVQLTTLNGGEVINGGDKVKIMWTTTAVEGGVMLELSTNGGETFPNFIAMVPATKGLYSWTVPLGLNTTSARLKATLVSRTLPPYEVWSTDVSAANFTIVPKLVLRFTEVPAEVSAGRYFPLRWDMFDPDERVSSLNLRMRVRDNTSWGAWADLGGMYHNMPATKGGIWWAPPYYEEATIQLRIQALSSHATVLAENDSAEIPIRSPIIRLRQPNGGEVMVGGQPYEIKWVTANDGYDIIVGVQISYSLNAGSSWTIITWSSENDFSYTWNVPSGVNSELVLIKISAQWGEWYNFANDTSDGFCTIISDPNTLTVSLTDPNPDEPGGIIIGGGERYTIRWSSTGSRSQVSSFKIYLSTNNGTSWSNILNATNTASTITWTAPLIDTCEAKIRVVLIKTDSSTKSSQSVNPFYIYTTISFNRGPIASAGPDQEVSEGVLVRLDGSRSRDPDGDPLIYKWRQIAPPDPIVSLMNNGTASPSFIPSVIDYAVDFIFELEVWDGLEPTVPNYENISRVTVRVNPAPPNITSFSPSRAMTGMRVTIQGTNMMGAEILINGERTGTVLTAPTPSEPDPDRFYNFTLTPNVPHAPGHITLRTRAGEATHPDLIEVYPIPEFCYEYGFSFDNIAKGELSYPWAFWNEGNYKDTFGEDEVYINIWVCVGIPYWTPRNGWECLGYEISQPIAPDPFAALVYGVGYWYLARHGRCYGYSATALQIKNGVVEPQDLQAGVYHTPNLTLGGNVERRIDFMHGSQISSRQLGWIIENHINNLGPTGMPICLASMREFIDRGIYGIVSIVDGTSGHAMVPYLIEDIDPTHTRVYVYDPNRPYYSSPDAAVNAILNYDFPNNHPPYIEIDRSGTYWRWEFYMAGGSRWGGTQGMVFIPFNIVNGDRSLPLSVEGLMDWIFGSATSAIEDSEGRRVAIEENGSWTGGIPNATPVVPMGVADGGGFGYYLPRGNYTTRIKGVADGSYSWLQSVDGNASVALEGAGVRNGTRDTLKVSYDGGNPLQSRLSYRTSDGEKVYNATLVKKMGTEQRRPRERVYKIMNADLFGDSEAVINASADLSSLVFFNNGPHSFTFDVEFQGNVVMESLWNSSNRPTGLPNVTRKGITIGPYQTMVIRPSDWLNLMNSTVIIEGETVAREPRSPVNISTAAFRDRVTVTWSPPLDDGGSPITGYVVLRGKSAAILTLLVELGNITSYTDSSVAPGETYYYAVLARNSVGSSEPTAPVSATVPKKPSPPKEGEGGMPLWLLGLVIVVVVAAAAGAGATLMRRRKKSPPATPAYPGSQGQGPQAPAGSGGAPATPPGPPAPPAPPPAPPSGPWPPPPAPPPESQAQPPAPPPSQ